MVPVDEHGASSSAASNFSAGSHSRTLAATSSAQDVTIRPFRVNVPEAAVTDLQRRLAATRWPDRETVADRSQGVKLEQQFVVTERGYELLTTFPFEEDLLGREI